MAAHPHDAPLDLSWTAASWPSLRLDCTRDERRPVASSQMESQRGTSNRRQKRDRVDSSLRSSPSHTCREPLCCCSGSAAESPLREPRCIALRHQRKISHNTKLF
ncbi:hypothetical protein Hamer_G002731 [Homarus americanus]|uniref:Uncharacterized protein n=1 Tax=Homarus americanus TaxID=6706 RepID=A0A8J5MTZ2_HOMAM|nr:hypothetical protein Hamer_G002731 [Homarus americanus]